MVVGLAEKGETPHVLQRILRKCIIPGECRWERWRGLNIEVRRGEDDDLPVYIPNTVTRLTEGNFSRGMAKS